jgi:hypothetical protein
MNDLRAAAAGLAAFLRGQTPGRTDGPDATVGPQLVFDTQGRTNDRARLAGFAGPSGVDIVTRFCCALGGSTSPVIDLAELSAQNTHEYRPKANEGAIGQLPGGGLNGFVYTGHGGFVDIGHVRDNIDYARYFAIRYDTHWRGDTVRLFAEAGEIHIVVSAHPQRPTAVLAALVGARLAYERALWHEVASYFDNRLVRNEQFSAFSPEDNFSNAVGVLAGFNAMLTADKSFNQAADQALAEVLRLLAPVGKDTGEAALEFVADHWWKSSLFGAGPTPDALRRNVDAMFPVQPWLVTEVDLGGTTDGIPSLRSLGRPAAASISFPTRHDGLVLDNLAQLEVRGIESTSADPRTAALALKLAELAPRLRTFGSDPQRRGRITRADIPVILAAIRAQESAVSNPGPRRPPG